MILIGPELEQALAAVACCCDISIDWTVLDQIKHDSRENQVDPKQYVLHDTKRIRLSATVDAYEPETITLHFIRGRCKQFDSIISTASSTGFGVHAHFFDWPQKPPRFLADAISSAHASIDPRHSILRIAFVAVRHLNAITRCFLKGTGIRPTPYLVYATNVRTMLTQQLNADDATPYTIKGYR